MHIWHVFLTSRFVAGNTDSDFSAMAQKEIYKKQYYNDFISRYYDLMGGDLSYGKSLL